MRVDWSMVWAALQAIGTVAAAGIALGLGVRESKKRTEAEKREAEETAKVRALEERRRRESQAAKVIGWYSPPVEGRARVFVANGSDRPIFDVTATCVAFNGNRTVTTETMTTVRPGEGWLRLPDGFDTYNDAEAPIDTILVFRDAEDVWWKRTNRGELLEVDESYRPVQG